MSLPASSSNSRIRTIRLCRSRSTSGGRPVTGSSLTGVFVITAPHPQAWSSASVTVLGNGRLRLGCLHKLGGSLQSSPSSAPTSSGKVYEAHGGHDRDGGGGPSRDLRIVS